MKFGLFSERTFEVKYPKALIEAYCFQSDFYKNYDLLRNNGKKRSVDDVNKIGARIKAKALSKSKRKLERYKELPIFGFCLDEFLQLDQETMSSNIYDLSSVIRELDDIKGIGLSKTTKILHTLYPKIIPIIDNELLTEYKCIKNEKRYDRTQIFSDYYTNFLTGETYRNLCEVHKSLSYLGLTKVRIFDILWWSYLKAQKIKSCHKVKWHTIQSLKSL